MTNHNRVFGHYAVDDMTIQIGTRTVRGVIRKREEARAIYEQAKQTGHVAGSLICLGL